MDTIMWVICIALGVLCGGMVAAGILLSWMVRSNVYGEDETQEEFREKQEITYNEADRGSRVLFF